GGLSWTEREGVTVTALARTSGRTMRLPAEAALMRPSPFDILNNWPQTSGRIETVALRLSGALETAFPEGRPAEAPAPAAEGEDAPPAPPPQQQAREPLTRSATPAEIVIVADADFLADDFYVDPQSGGAASLRRMELVEQMEADADRRIRRLQEELQAELQETEARLAQLEARGRGSGFFSGNLGAELTPEENAEIERFRARVVEVRSEL